jgi:hypothetical protein
MVPSQTAAGVEIERDQKADPIHIRLSRTGVYHQHNHGRHVSTRENERSPDVYAWLHSELRYR